MEIRKYLEFVQELKDDYSDIHHDYYVNGISKQQWSPNYVAVLELDLNVASMLLLQNKPNPVQKKAEKISQWLNSRDLQGRCCEVSMFNLDGPIRLYTINFENEDDALMFRLTF